MVHFVGVKTYYYTLLSSSWTWHLLHRKPASAGTSRDCWHAQGHNVRNNISYLLLVFFHNCLYSSYQDYHKFKKTHYFMFYRLEKENSSILQINPAAKRTVIWPSKRQRFSLATFIKLLLSACQDEWTHTQSNKLWAVKLSVQVWQSSFVIVKSEEAIRAQLSSKSAKHTYHT